MNLTSSSIQDGARIPAKFAFCDIEPSKHASFAENLNPHFKWTDVPTQTQSFALICVDYDCPSAGDDVNQEGREVPSELPRVDFYHWLLLNIPACTTEIQEGAHSTQVTPNGKGKDAPEDMLHGANDYTSWFESDPDMRGDYFGYDGPCPPWNDSIIHHYKFTLYALDVESFDLSGPFRGPDAIEAIQDHIIATASLTATYTMTPRLR